MCLVVCSFPVNTVICNGQTEGRSFFLPLSLQVIAKTNEHIEARLVTLYFKMSSSLKYRYTEVFFVVNVQKDGEFNLMVNKIFCFLLTVQILCWFVFNIFFSCTQILFTLVSFDIGTMQRFYMLMVQFYCCQVCRGCSYTWISITY